MLSVEGLSRRMGDFALRDVSLRVEEGEFFVLLGPTGAGKSVLLEMVAGFSAPDEGRIRIDGEDAARLPPEERGVGVVYQDHMLFPHRSVRANIHYGMRMRGVPGDEAEARARELSEALDIEHLLGRRPSSLSGGEKQRVALARALAPRPRLLLLDEPFSSLDPPVREMLRRELKELHRRRSFATLMVTHSRADARALGERVGVMHDGAIQQVGPPDAVFGRPDSRLVAHFMGGTNIYRGEAERNGELTRFRDGRLEMVSTAEAEGPCRAVIRPENILLSRRAISSSARNEFRGVVRSVRRDGSTCRVEAEVEGRRMVAVVTPPSVRELALEPGAEVYLSFKAHNVHLFTGDETEGEAE